MVVTERSRSAGRAEGSLSWIFALTLLRLEVREWRIKRETDGEAAMNAMGEGDGVIVSVSKIVAERFVIGLSRRRRAAAQSAADTPHCALSIKRQIILTSNSGHMQGDGMRVTRKYNAYLLEIDGFELEGRAPHVEVDL